ncbi:MAG: NosD domain-containing protein [Candidatus Woesearchaeota archaeon]
MDNKKRGEVVSGLFIAAVFLIVAFSAFSIVSSVTGPRFSDDCVNPTLNYHISESVLFCPGTYNAAETYQVTGQNIIIDCNGATIRNGNFILQANGITLKNCNLIDGSIYAGNLAPNTKILDNTFDNNIYDRIYIQLSQSSGHELRGNNFIGGVQYFLTLSSVTQSTISGNTMDSATGQYIKLTSSTDNVIENNEISGDVGIGVNLDTNSNSNSIRDNEINNIEQGIKISTSNNNQINNNQINNNVEGIYIERSSSSTITSNTINSNRYGIRLHDQYNAVKDNFISGNSFEDNYCSGIKFEIYPSRTTISSNNFIGNGIPCGGNEKGGGIVFDGGSDNDILNNDMTGDETGIYMSLANDNLIQGNDIIASNARGIALYSSSRNTIQNNNISEQGVGVEIGLSALNNVLNNNEICSNRIFDLRCANGGGGSGNGNYIDLFNNSGGSCSAVGYSACSEVIPPDEPVCGNGELEEGEECDDGNLINGDGCSADCMIEGEGAVCGNGVLENGEECDDGNLINGDGCSDDCMIEGEGAVCGNGVLENGEECDCGSSWECTLEGLNNKTCYDFGGDPDDGYLSCYQPSTDSPCKYDTTHCEEDDEDDFKCGDGKVSYTKGEYCDINNNDLSHCYSSQEYKNDKDLQDLEPAGCEKVSEDCKCIWSLIIDEETVAYYSYGTCYCPEGETCIDGIGISEKVRTIVDIVNDKVESEEVIDKISCFLKSPGPNRTIPFVENVIIPFILIVLFGAFFGVVYRVMKKKGMI